MPTLTTPCTASEDVFRRSDLHNAALAESVNASSEPQFCGDAASSSLSLPSRPSCHTLLFHGRLHHGCLEARNISVESLTCIRSLYITSFPGSGTAAMARRLEYAMGLAGASAHENQMNEPQVLISWMSRTNVWQLPQPTCLALAVDDSGYQFYPWMRGKHTNGMGSRMYLGRCLYRRVLLQTREPLAAIRSMLSRFCSGTSYFVMADHLVSRSGSAHLDACRLPVAPTDWPCPMTSRRRWMLNNTKVRRPVVRYLLRLWFHWMRAALDAADAHYAVESVWPRPLNESVCELAGFGATACLRDDPALAIVRLAGENTHSSRDAVHRIDWDEAEAADPQAARIVKRLSEELGYRYDGVGSA